MSPAKRVLPAPPPLRLLERPQRPVPRAPRPDVRGGWWQRWLGTWWRGR